MDWPADKVERRNISELIPYVRNSRTHSEAQVGQIAASIREWGWTMPILCDENGNVIAGHGRIMAAQKLGIDDVPCMTATGWSEAKRRAYVIADNKLALNADWDNEALGVEFAELKELGFDLELTGFDLNEIDELFPVDEAEGLTDEDAIPEAPEKPITVEGDIWVLGNHRLMCGDSTSIDSIDKLMDGNVPNAIITDPPYGIGIDGQKKSVAKNPKHNRKHHDKKDWDSKRPDDSIFNYVVSLNVPCVIWGGNYFSDLLPPSRGWLYWNKGQDGLTMSDGELAWTTEDKPLRSKTVNRASLQGSVHPTQKPVDIITFSADYLSVPQKGSILDLFSGSGTVAIACEKTNRRSFMMEREVDYCDVIIKRWQDFTGEQATLQSTGQTYDELKAEREVA